MGTGGQDGLIARLVLVNGVPGAGKTTVARRVVDELPLALLLDVDAVRTTLGQWDRDESSRLLARQLATAMADAHLVTGHDVVISQYVGRLSFVEGLETLAGRSGATFVECLLDVPPEVAIARFRARRAHLADAGERHPEGDFPDDAVEAEVHEAHHRLRELAARRPSTHIIPVDDDAAVAAAAVRAVIDRT